MHVVVDASIMSFGKLDTLNMVRLYACDIIKTTHDNCEWWNFYLRRSSLMNIFFCSSANSSLFPFSISYFIVPTIEWSLLQ